MNLQRELRAQIANFRAAIKRDLEPDAATGCGISWLAKLPKDSPWMDEELCDEHDALFKAGTKTKWEVQTWWLLEGWKRATTWRKKVFFLATVDLVMSWTAVRYQQRVPAGRSSGAGDISSERSSVAQTPEEFRENYDEARNKIR